MVEQIELKLEQVEAAIAAVKADLAIAPTNKERDRLDRKEANLRAKKVQLLRRRRSMRRT